MNRAFIRYIHTRSERGPAGSADFAGDSVHLFGAARGDKYPRTVTREPERDATADSSSAAGDDGGSSLEARGRPRAGCVFCHVLSTSPRDFRYFRSKLSGGSRLLCCAPTPRRLVLSGDEPVVRVI